MWVPSEVFRAGHQNLKGYEEAAQAFGSSVTQRMASTKEYDT